MTTISKIVAGSLMSALLLPTMAFAHEGEVKAKANANVHANIGVRIDKALERIENKGTHDERKDERKAEAASTTAARITAKATQIQASVDSMLGYNARVLALIASSSNKAALEATFNTYTTAAANAKVEAGNAITGAAKVNANNSTTTNADIIAAAKVDLKDAKGLLHDAMQTLFSIFRSLWQ